MVYTSLAEEVEEKKDNGFDVGEEDTFFKYPNYPQTSRYLEMMDSYTDYVDVSEDTQETYKLAITPDGYTMHGIGVQTGLPDDYGDSSWYSQQAPPGSWKEPAATAAPNNASNGFNAAHVVAIPEVYNAIPMGASNSVVNAAANKTASAVATKMSGILSGVLLARVSKWALLQPYVLAGVLTIVLLSGNKELRQNTHDQWGRIFGLAIVDIVPTVLYGLAVWYWWFDKKISAWLSVGMTFATGIVVHAMLGLATPLNQALFWFLK